MNLTFACGSEISENLSTFPPVLLLKPLFVVFPVLLKTYHDSILSLRPTHTWSWYCDTEIVSPSMLQSPKASVPPLRVQDIPIPASCADGVHHVPQIQSYSSVQPCCCVWFRISKSKSCTPPTIQHLKTTAWKRYQMNQVEVAKLQPGLLRFSPSVTMPRTWRAASKSQSDISWKGGWLWASIYLCCRTRSLADYLIICTSMLQNNYT